MKKLNSIIIYILAVLSAELLVEFIKHLIHIKTGTKSPYLNTIIGMTVIVAIFIPIIKLSEWLFESITEKVVHKTKDAVGSNFMGLLIAFIIGLGILFLFYLKEWYGKTLW